MSINVAVVCGILTNEPTSRDLADGTTVVQFDISTSVERHDNDKAVNVSVPVSWRNPTAAAVAALVQGDEIVASGSIERRFFRSGGATLSRTELVATRCLPARRTKSVRSLLAAAAAAVEP